ncbi:MAG: AAA domain-containing protein [Paraprevotella sp.]|nr:AAA domain-containing protein [Paraprevotella sp.]
MSDSSLLYLQKLRRLLELEFEYEKELFHRQTEATGISRKIRQGICWYPLSLGRSYYNSLNQLVVEVERTEHTEQDHGFEPGKPICFFTQDASGELGGRHGDGMLHYLPFTATVSFIDGNLMVAAWPDTEALTQLRGSERIGVQLYLDETTYRLMFEALDRTMTARHDRIAELREIFHGTAKAGKFTFQPLRLPWLNPTQEAAVNEVLRAKDVMIVHGPPGTGKTTTLVEAIYETLHRESQIMVCAQSNMSVDLISEKLSDRGVSVLRIGNPSRVNDKMLSSTYERRFESHPSYPQLWAIRKAIRDLYAHRSLDRREAFHQKIARLRDRATELEITINENLFNEARVIACTLTGSANRVLAGKKFPTLFIDEAAQALEASCWIAIPKAGRVILAGDHRQLPPTVKCPEALRNGLDRTLMEAIAERQPSAVSLLRTQYRMNDTIMQFSSACFYDGKVESAPEVKYRGILDWDSPMEWIDTADETQTARYRTEERPETQEDHEADSPTAADFSEASHPDSTSRTNPEEARLTLNILKAYFRKIGKERILEERLDTGIISPYKGQVQLLRGLLRRDTFFKPYRHLLTVNTVDGFQGQERDIILISMVRSNADGQIGFLHDLRRMNVAITRARMKLILVGDSRTLCRTPFYKRLYDYIQTQ